MREGIYYLVFSLVNLAFLNFFIVFERLLAFVNVPRGCTIEQFASLLREPNFYKSTSRSTANNFIAEIEQKLQMLFRKLGIFEI